MGTCLYCGEIFENTKWNRKFCDKKCQGKYRRNTQCLEQSRYFKDRYAKNRDSILDKVKNYYTKNKEEIFKRQKSYYPKMRIKHKVEAETINRLSKPSSCILCGKTINLVWHHFSYNKPDSWKDCAGVCRRICHRILDDERREAEAKIKEAEK